MVERAVTSSEAQRALAVARMALVEVGGDPAVLFVVEDIDGVSHLHSRRPGRREWWRALAIGAAAVDPSQQCYCFVHFWPTATCARVTAAEAARGVDRCRAAA